MVIRVSLQNHMSRVSKQCHPLSKQCYHHNMTKTSSLLVAFYIFINFSGSFYIAFKSFHLYNDQYCEHKKRLENNCVHCTQLYSNMCKEAKVSHCNVLPPPHAHSCSNATNFTSSTLFSCQAVYAH